MIVVYQKILKTFSVYIFLFLIFGEDVGCTDPVLNAIGKP